MLKETLSHFYALADQARTTFRDSAPKVTDAIIDAAFPETVAASLTEGCHRMFREGVKEAVVKYMRKPCKHSRQRTFDDIAPKLMPLVEPLGSVAYYVPGRVGSGEYVSVPDLCHDQDALDAARKFMRRKGEETLSEADKLDQLYHAAFPA
jgi:hypothetical protein